MDRKKSIRHLMIAPFLVLMFIMLGQPVLAGNSVTVSGEILPGNGPVAAFSGTPVTGTAPLNVRFTDLSTGTITSWRWDFTNDGIPDSRVKNPVYRYTRPGTYSVRLTVTGQDGSDSEVKTSYITVTPPVKRPVARFTSDGYIGRSPLTVTFSDRSLNNPAVYRWRFGDGTTSDEKNPVHTFSRVGVYTVRLTVSNTAGTDSTSHHVFVFNRWY